VEKAEDYIVEDERLCNFIDDDDCRYVIFFTTWSQLVTQLSPFRATFVYGYQNETGYLRVWVQETKECPVVVDLMGLILGVIGAIVCIGMVFIIMWKVISWLKLSA